jgi:hypothetical protein
MAVLKYYDGSDWEPVASALVGPTGPTGATGPTGSDASSGLVLISTTSFSAVSSVSLPDDTFTSTYDNYLWILDFTCSGGVNLTLRMRASGSDDTTSNYQLNRMTVDEGAVAAVTSTNQNAFAFGFASTGRASAKIEINSPNIARPTLFWTFQNEQGNTTALATRMASGGHNVSTAYDSATMLINANNITGTYSVYGYSK